MRWPSPINEPLSREWQDRAYRLAARRVIARLLEENRRLRHRPHYRQGRISAVLADALHAWFLRRGWLDD